LQSVGAVIEDAVVLLDRGQGGHEILQKAGIRLHRSLQMMFAISLSSSPQACSVLFLVR